MNEFELIKYLTKDSQKKRKDIIYSIGDDAAVVNTAADYYLLYTVDSLVENIHFKLTWPLPINKLFYLLGWKALAINVSDILAMGGWPLDALISLNIPQKTNQKLLKIFYQGLNDCAKQYKISIIGGNVTKANKEFVITVTLTGKVRKKHLLLRSNAQTGDYIYTQFGLGYSGAGLKLLNNNFPKWNIFIDAHLKPQPNIKWNNLFKKYKINACIDISDGLLGDLNHVLTSSKKGAELYFDNFIIHPLMKKMFPRQFKDLILYGGEDYKIVFTSKDKIDEPEIIMIGKISKGKDILYIENNKKQKLSELKGFEHFK